MSFVSSVVWLVSVKVWFKYIMSIEEERVCSYFILDMASFTSTIGISGRVKVYEPLFL